MTVFPVCRSVALKVATASSRAETLPISSAAVRPAPAGRSHSVGRDRTRQRSRPSGRRRAAPRSARRWTPVFLRLESGLRTASGCRRRGHRTRDRRRRRLPARRCRGPSLLHSGLFCSWPCYSQSPSRRSRRSTLTLYLASTWIAPVLIAITFHEAAHAYAAQALRQ